MCSKFVHDFHQMRDLLENRDKLVPLLLVSLFSSISYLSPEPEGALAKLFEGFVTSAYSRATFYSSVECLLQNKETTYTFFCRELRFSESFLRTKNKFMGKAYIRSRPPTEHRRVTISNI